MKKLITSALLIIGVIYGGSVYSACTPGGIGYQCNPGDKMQLYYYYYGASVDGTGGIIQPAPWPDNAQAYCKNGKWVPDSSPTSNGNVSFTCTAQ